MFDHDYKNVRGPLLNNTKAIKNFCYVDKPTHQPAHSDCLVVRLEECILFPLQHKSSFVHELLNTECSRIEKSTHGLYIVHDCNQDLVGLASGI